MGPGQILAKVSISRYRAEIEDPEQFHAQRLEASGGLAGRLS